MLWTPDDRKVGDTLSFQTKTHVGPTHIFYRWWNDRKIKVAPGSGPPDAPSSSWAPSGTAATVYLQLITSVYIPLHGDWGYRIENSVSMCIKKVLLTLFNYLLDKPVLILFSFSTFGFFRFIHSHKILFNQSKFVCQKKWIFGTFGSSRFVCNKISSRFVYRKILYFVHVQYVRVGHVNTGSLQSTYISFYFWQKDWSLHVE